MFAALQVTFGFYRVAQRFEVDAAYCAKQGPVDTKLIAGACLFGVGWGLTGLCPGPVLVSLVGDVASHTPTGGPALTLLSICLGLAMGPMLYSRIRTCKDNGYQKL